MRAIMREFLPEVEPQRRRSAEKVRGTEVPVRPVKLPRKFGPDSGRIVKERCGAGVRALCDRKYSIFCRVCQGVFVCHRG